MDIVLKNKIHLKRIFKIIVGISCEIGKRFIHMSSFIQIMPMTHISYNRRSFLDTLQNCLRARVEREYTLPAVNNYITSSRITLCANEKLFYIMFAFYINRFLEDGGMQHTKNHVGKE